MRLNSIRCKTSLLALGLALVSTPIVADEPDACWTAVASTGRVDEQNEKRVFTDTDGEVRLNSGLNAASVTANVRYNVTAVDGAANGVSISLTVRYRNNADSTVQFKLRRNGVNAGSTALVLDTGELGDTSNVYTTATYCVDEAFDFENYAYNIELTLRRTAQTGDPRVRVLKLCGNDAVCL